MKNFFWKTVSPLAIILKLEKKNMTDHFFHIGMNRISCKISLKFENISCMRVFVLNLKFVGYKI